jgi:3-oxoacyl-[acyl-carrier protein] reductase
MISHRVIYLFYPKMVYDRTVEKIFAGKNALVIGGTGGIGAAVARGLAERGARLVIQGGSSPERLDRILKTIRNAGGEAEGFLYRASGLNGGAAAMAVEVLARARELFGAASLEHSTAAVSQGSPLDILVCAWGPFKRGAIGDMSPADWYDMIENNLVLPGIMISSVIRGMMDRGWGRILLFGGANTGAIRGFQTTAAYSAAKTAMGVLAKSVAVSAGPRGVSANVICPGLTDTEYCDEPVRAYNRERSPGGKALRPEDIAKIALEILENPHINGAVIPVDQGLVL